jgi:hypothetical protein
VTEALRLPIHDLGSDREPDHALAVAVLRQAIADCQTENPSLRREARLWFATGQHQPWLDLLGLSRSALDKHLAGLQPAPEALAGLRIRQHDPDVQAVKRLKSAWRRDLRKASKRCIQCNRRLYKRSHVCSRCAARRRQYAYKRWASLRFWGLCRICSQATLHGKWLCETCIAIIRARKLGCLQRGLCPRCQGKHPVAPGRHSCVHCHARACLSRQRRRETIRASNRVYYRTNRESLRAVWNAHHRLQRQRWKAQGLCMACGQVPKEAGTQCGRCAEDKRRRSAALSLKRKSQGLCVSCGREARPGQGKCARCAEKARQNTARYRACARQAAQNG